MIEGKMYRIVTKEVPGVWRKPREMVFKYIGETDNNYVFSARPVAGTQEIAKNQVAVIQQQPDDAKVYLPRILRGPVS